MKPYYNREGWSYQMTLEQFKNRLVVAEKDAVIEKAVPQLPKGMSVKGKTAVRVLIDPDGNIQAAAVEKTVAGIEKELIQAAKKSKYAKMRDHLERPTHYVTLITFVLQ
jgi:outer membrane biosynthesis protein TonB